MSLLASETQHKVAAFREALLAVEAHVRPLLEKPPQDVHRKLAPLEDAELQVALVYGVASLYFSHLLTQGVDPANHPIRQELDRIQMYFKKVRAAKEQLDAQEEVKRRARLDAEAAGRIVKNITLVSKAAVLRRGGPGQAPPMPPLDATEEPAAAIDLELEDEDAAAETPGKRRRRLAAAEQSPAEDVPDPPEAVEAAASAEAGEQAAEAAAGNTGEQPAGAPELLPPAEPSAAAAEAGADGGAPEAAAEVAAEEPAWPEEVEGAAPQGFPLGAIVPLATAADASSRRRRARKGPADAAAPAGAAPAAAAPPAGGGRRQLRLVPVGPAGAEEHATAAALEAQGRAEAARKKRKKRRLAAEAEVEAG